ncbi:MAG: helix-turn-helix domain-containing protein [Treponema sp.]|jgi:transcriptional regulator with XRE-family HTH domain|nr:helix-turn-helix domain-containing protein [Treponema sp.]
MAKRFDGQEIRELFSRNLKLLRHHNNLSQLALSVKAGLAHNFVNDIENGKKWVSPNTIAKLAGVLDVEPGAFFQSNPLDPPETWKIRSYLDELSMRFTQAVGDIKENYLPYNEKKDNPGR